MLAVFDRRGSALVKAVLATVPVIQLLRLCKLMRLGWLDGTDFDTLVVVDEWR